LQGKKPGAVYPIAGGICNQGNKGLCKTGGADFPSHRCCFTWASGQTISPGGRWRGGHISTTTEPGRRALELLFFFLSFRGDDDRRNRPSGEPCGAHLRVLPDIPFRTRISTTGAPQRLPPPQGRPSKGGECKKKKHIPVRTGHLKTLCPRSGPPSTGKAKYPPIYTGSNCFATNQTARISSSPTPTTLGHSGRGRTQRPTYSAPRGGARGSFGKHTRFVLKKQRGGRACGPGPKGGGREGCRNDTLGSQGRGANTGSPSKKQPGRGPHVTGVGAYKEVQLWLVCFGKQGGKDFTAGEVKSGGAADHKG